MRAVQRVVLLEFAVNIAVAAVKIAVGSLARNLTVISDGLHGLLDGLNNVFGLIGLRFSYRPADEEHPYGHRKVEALMALAVGAVMALASWEILRAVAARWFSDGAPPPHRFDPMFAGAIVATFIANIAISQYEIRQGRKLKSPFLVADATHTRSHVAMDVLALISLVFAGTYSWVDSALALVVVAFILRAGWTIVRDNTTILIDTVQIDSEPIRRTAESVAGVENCHAVRSHGMPDDVHLDLHIVIEPGLSAEAAQEIESSVRKALFERFSQVTNVSIHHQTHPPVHGGPIDRAH